MNELRSFIRALLESKGSAAYNALKRYANVDISGGEYPSFSNRFTLEIRDLMNSNEGTFVPWRKSSPLYRGMSFNLQQFKRFFRDKEPTIIVERGKEVIVFRDVIISTYRGRISSSWSWSPVIASEFAASAGSDTFDGYEVLLETSTKKNPPNTFLDVVETLKYESEHHEAEVLALGPVKCDAKCYRVRWGFDDE